MPPTEFEKAIAEAAKVDTKLKTEPKTDTARYGKWFDKEWKMLHYYKIGNGNILHVNATVSLINISTSAHGCNQMQPITEAEFIDARNGVLAQMDLI